MKRYGATRAEVAAAKFITVAVCEDDGRPDLQCVYHDPEGCLVSTDGHRLHVADHMGDGSGRRQNPTTLQPTGSEQPYPDWRKVAPAVDTTVTLDVRQLLGAVAGAVEVAKASGKKRCPELVLEWRPDKDTLSVVASVASAHDEAMTGTVLRGERDGETCMAVTVNGRYLLDALRALAVRREDDEAAEYEPVRLAHSGPFSPVVLENDRLHAYLMPMRHDDDRGRSVQCALERIADKAAELGMGAAQ